LRVLIDIGHPAHVHLFKNLALNLSCDGHQVLFTVREKECSVDLLAQYGFTYYSLGSMYRGVPGKLFGLLKFNSRLLARMRAFRPDVVISHGSPYAAQTAWLMGISAIALEDTMNMEQVRLYKPFVKVILSPEAIRGTLGRKHFKYNGYHELAYLHPRYFTPDRSVYGLLGLEDRQSYAILRFVSWTATHDQGHSGINRHDQTSLVELLSGKIRLFISSEKELPPSLERYRLVLPPYRIHDVLAFATLFIGEGATMASECAMLGTPAIYVSSQEHDTINDQEKYGLIFRLTDVRLMREKASEVMDQPDIREAMGKRRRRMLQDKIDVTAFLTSFIEGFPGSYLALQNTPGRHIVYPQPS
jgi:predicted glycosyltransferase